MDRGDPDSTPFPRPDEFGEELLRVVGHGGSWAAVNRVPADEALWLVCGEDRLWLVCGEDRDDGDDWTAAPLDEHGMATRADDGVVLAGCIVGAAQIEVLIDGIVHTAAARSDGFWLLLIEGVHDAEIAAVRALDRRGEPIDEAVIELPCDAGPELASMRSRLRMWLARGMRKPSRGIAVYGRR